MEDDDRKCREDQPAVCGGGAREAETSRGEHDGEQARPEGEVLRERGEAFRAGQDHCQVETDFLRRGVAVEAGVVPRRDVAQAVLLVPQQCPRLVVRQAVPVVRRGENGQSAEVDAGDEDGHREHPHDRVAKRVPPARVERGRRRLPLSEPGGKRDTGDGHDDEDERPAAQHGREREERRRDGKPRPADHVCGQDAQGKRVDSDDRRGDPAPVRETADGRREEEGAAHAPRAYSGDRLASASIDVRDYDRRRERPAVRPHRARRRRHGRDGTARGRAAVALAARGMRVAILDLETEPRAGAAGLRTGLDDGTIRVHECDVTDREPGRGGARARRGRLGRPAPARQRGRDRLAARRSRLRGRAVRGCAARVARARRARQRPRRRRAVPGDRRRDGARRPRLDRQRRLGLRPALARPGALRLPARRGRVVLQAGRVLGLEVGAR